jgi:heptosyltransferase-2
VTRIVVIQTAFPGDVVLSTPVFEALKEGFPGCETVAVVRPESAELLEYNPYIDRVISFDKYGADRGLSGLIRMSSRLKGCEKAIIIQRHFRSAALAYLAGIPVRIGYSNSKARFFYTNRVAYVADKHEVQRCLDLIGIDDDENRYRPRIFFNEGVENKVCRPSNGFRGGGSGVHMADEKISLLSGIDSFNR